ncbi:hypothetical protein ES288_D05G161300v1 [Gossypium darwinii]|uniref:Uncharacterized protein n=1 Tax=Gossypium darwinii TaxID=34276 RepID=A0A5D2CK49_GOSDA|nr:hypothetical protein ES288_D05G161300v1 [Gossypium darwinii]
MSNFYGSNLNEGNEISMTTSPFSIDQVFESCEELMQWVQNTAFSLGYIIVTRRSKAKEIGVVSYVTLICDRGGEYKFKESSKKSGSYLKQYDGWTLRVICDQHNHPPAQHMEGHSYARRLKENEKNLLVDLTSKNVTPRDILSTLKEQDENNVFTLKIIYNARQKLRSSQNVGVLKYLDQVWLSKYKEMFVSVWIDRHLNFEERTTNRVKSQHAKLKKYLCAKNSSLDKFVVCIDQIVKSQLTSIYESFEKSRIVLKHNLLCFRLLRGFVALEALDILEGELQRSSRHQLDSSNCGCKLRHSCGLPCACMLSIYLNSGECIPLDSIDVFWRKLDLSPSTSVENEDICCDGELEILLRKLRDIFQPSKTLIKEPTIQNNMRVRPTLKKQQQKRVNSISQAPKRRSHSTTSKSIGLDLVELNKVPARHSSHVIEISDLNHEPSEQASDFIDLNQMPESCGTHPLMKEIPDMFHPYITHVQDVRGDGNYGFRAISVCHGYGEDQWLYVQHQLLNELLSSYDVYARVFTYGIDELRNSLCFSQSPAPADHWMVMPMTGVLIANRFGVILNYLTKQCDITFFPIWRGPEHFQYHHAITIAHVYDNHNVMVQLEGDYPMPTMSTRIIVE